MCNNEKHKNERYTSYCKECHKNLCLICEANHDKKHNCINFRDLINENNLDLVEYEKTIVKNKYSLNRESPDKTSNKIIMKNTNPNNNKFNQVKVNQNQIKQAQSYTNQTISYHHQQFRNLSSHKINQTKTQLFYQPQNTQFQIKASTPLPSQLTSIGDEKNDIYKQISHQQIALAQMASLQNQENPNFENLHVITLGKNPKIVEEISKQNDYQEINDNNIEEPQEQEENKGLNIEALFITEEGRY